MNNRLAEFRERLGLDQGELAGALGISRQTIASIERGKYDPSLPFAKDLARFFRVAVEDVFPAPAEEAIECDATFVMTDIVGSTKLVDRLGKTYVDLLERHRELLVEVFTRHGGRVVDDTGDACFAVFEQPVDGIAAALAAQRAIAAEPWPLGVEVSIRAGIHTGRAYAIGNRFVGMAVHETARVCARAEAGQVLVSESTARAGPDPQRLGEGMDVDLAGVGRRRLYVVR